MLEHRYLAMDVTAAGSSEVLGSTTVAIVRCADLPRVRILCATPISSPMRVRESAPSVLESLPPAHASVQFAQNFFQCVNPLSRCPHRFLALSNRRCVDHHGLCTQTQLNHNANRRVPRASLAYRRETAQSLQNKRSPQATNPCVHVTPDHKA